MTSSALRPGIIALCAAALCAIGALLPLWQSGEGVEQLLIPGSNAAATPIIYQDFGHIVTHTELGHDGAMMYAIARDPLNFEASTPYLDRPQYRLQRPGLPWLSRVLHPHGTGRGLVWAMFAAQLVTVGAGAFGLARLIQRHGGNASLAILYGLVPGVVLSQMMTLADGMALSLALCAIACANEKRWYLATAFGTVAALTKESILLMLWAWACAELWQRRWTVRTTAAFALIPTAAIGAWILYIKATVAPSSNEVIEFGWPFQGIYQAIAHYSGSDALSWFYFGLAALLALAVASAQRRQPTEFTRSILCTIAVQAAFITLLAAPVVGEDQNSSRILAPIMALGLLGVATNRGTLATTQRNATGSTSQSEQTPQDPSSLRQPALRRYRVAP